MEELPTTYYFGRIHLNRTLVSFLNNQKEWVKNQILKFLEGTDKIPLEKSDLNFNWYLGGISTEENLIIGKLGRVRKTKTKVFYDREKRDFREEIVKDEDGTYSNFFIDINKMLIIFERRKIIGHRQFIKIFCDAYNKFYKTKEGIDIEFLKDETKVEIIIKEAKIKRVKFDIRPVNPDADEEMKILDEQLKRMKARKAKLEFENKEEGLEFREKTLASSATTLCNRGYGDYIIEYEKDGEKRRISSKKEAIIRRESRPKDKIEAIKIAKKLLKYAYELLSGKNEK